MREDRFEVAYNVLAAPTHGELPWRIYFKLRDQIVRGRLRPGARAVEADLARRFGVSRTPVREALARLARERYLLPAGSGRRKEFLVAPLLEADVAELWGIIGTLEGHAIQVVAKLTTEERAALVSELERVNGDLEVAASARPRDNDQLGELMTAFHECFMNVCAGPYLRTLYDSVRPHVQRYEWAYGSQSDTSYAPSIADHRRIIAAVAAGNAREARDAVEQHWANGVERTNALIARLSGNATRARRA